MQLIEELPAIVGFILCISFGYTAVEIFRRSLLAVWERQGKAVEFQKIAPDAKPIRRELQVPVAPTQPQNKPVNPKARKRTRKQQKGEACDRELVKETLRSLPHEVQAVEMVKSSQQECFFDDRNDAILSALSVTENSPTAELDEGSKAIYMCNLLASDALGAMETPPNDKASEASESGSDSTHPTSLAMTEAPLDDQLSEEWERSRDEHDVADKEETTEEDEDNERDIEEHEESRTASRAKLLSGPWDEVLDDEDDHQVDEYAEQSYSPWERLLPKHLPAPERIEEGNEEEEEEAEHAEVFHEAEIVWGPHWNEANQAVEETKQQQYQDQQASRWSRGWGAESEYESLNDGWMVPFDDLIHGALSGSCFNAHSLSQPMPMAHAAEVFGENAVCIWSTTNPSGGVDGQSSTGGADIPKEVFTNGQQVFKPVPSADGQTLFTDGAQLFASVCVVMGPQGTDVVKSDGNLPLHQPGQLESQLKWSYEASDDEWD